MENIKAIRNFIIGFIINFIYNRKARNEHKFEFMFISMRGDVLGPNSKLFAEYLESKNYKIKYKMINVKRNKFLLLVDYMKAVNAMRECSEIVIDDFFFPLNHIKQIKDDQEIIQVWHALGSFKRVGIYAKHLNYTHVFLNSDCDIKHYKQVFAAENFHSFGMLRSRLYTDYEIRPQTTIKSILFAPTYRTEDKGAAIESWQQIIKQLKQEYNVVFSLHPYLSVEELDKNILDGVEVIRGESKILGSLHKYDALITDYSSIMFDYTYFERPIIQFVPDLDSYRKSVKFFTEIEEYDLSICKSAKQVLDTLKDEEEILRNLEAVKKLKAQTFNNEGNIEERMLSQLSVSKKVVK